MRSETNATKRIGYVFQMGIPSKTTSYLKFDKINFTIYYFFRILWDNENKTLDNQLYQKYK